MFGAKATKEEADRTAAEADRRKAAWEVFMEYHERSLWAVSKAEGAIEANAYLAPEAVSYMQHAIQVRKDQKDAYEARTKELETEDGKDQNVQHTQVPHASLPAVQAVRGSDQPHDAGDAAYIPGPAGEGKGGAGGGG